MTKLALLYPLIAFTVINYAFGLKDTNFAIMEVFGRSADKSEICVDVQKHDGRNRVPEENGAEEEFFRLLWWDFHPDHTTLCTAPRAPNHFGPRQMVPIDYFSRPDDLAEACKFRGSQFGNPLKYQLNLARDAGVQAFLFLVNRGAINVNGTHDYLHAEFCNQEAEGSGGTNESIFYMYKDDFDKFVSPKLRESNNVAFRLKTPSAHVDPGVFFLWLLILLAVGLGAFWTAAESKDRMVRMTGGGRDAEQGVELNTRSGNNPAQSAGEQQQQDDAPKTLGHILCRIIVVVVAVVMLIMALSGWFSLVLAILWTVLGIVCVSKCLFALFKYVIFPDQRRDQRVLLSVKNLRLTPMGLLCYGVALLICVPWFLLRHHPLAFVLLDLMNIAICAFFIKYNALGRYVKKMPTLKCQVVLCSIFLLFGIGAIFFLANPSAEKIICKTVAPIDEDDINVAGFLMPMFNNPLGVCWDVDVEKGYRHLFVTMFSVVVSALFLPFWFFIDLINFNNKKFPYFLFTFGAYALLLLTLLILSILRHLDIVHRASSLYLLLIPVPLIFGTLLALIKGNLGKLWNGNLVLNE